MMLEAVVISLVIAVVVTGAVAGALILVPARLRSARPARSGRRESLGEARRRRPMI